MGIRPLTALSRSVAPQGHRRRAGDETGAVEPLPRAAPAPKESLLSVIPPEGITDTPPWFGQYGRGLFFLILSTPMGFSGRRLLRTLGRSACALMLILAT